MSNSTDEPQARTSFDYEVLELNSRTVVRQRTDEIRERLQRAAQDIWAIGQKLVEVRSRLKHGQFEVWLRAEFGWSHRTAYNFISVYEAFAKTANFTEINIAASALYLLAAPSTPQKIRDQFVQRAEAGEKITYSNVRKSIKSVKPTPAALPSSEPSKPANSKPEIVDLLSQAKVEAKKRDVNAQEQQSSFTSADVTSDLSIQMGWYVLEERHLLFYGDTASPQFSEHIPQAALALAITSNDWDHDWLIDRMRTVIVFQESDLKEQLIEQLLLMFSKPGETVIFPWLPTPEMIEVAHKLERQVYAGDSNSMRCIEAIKRSGLRYQRIKL